MCSFHVYIIVELWVHFMHEYLIFRSIDSISRHPHKAKVEVNGWGKLNFKFKFNKGQGTWIDGLSGLGVVPERGLCCSCQGSNAQNISLQPQT